MLILLIYSFSSHFSEDRLTFDCVRYNKICKKSMNDVMHTANQKQSPK